MAAFLIGLSAFLLILAAMGIGLLQWWLTQRSEDRARDARATREHEERMRELDLRLALARAAAPAAQPHDERQGAGGEGFPLPYAAGYQPQDAAGAENNRDLDEQLFAHEASVPSYRPSMQQQ